MAFHVGRRSASKAKHEFVFFFKNKKSDPESDASAICRKEMAIEFQWKIFYYSWAAAVDTNSLPLCVRSGFVRVLLTAE